MAKNENINPKCPLLHGLINSHCGNEGSESVVIIPKIETVPTTDGNEPERITRFSLQDKVTRMPTQCPLGFKSTDGNEAPCYSAGLQAREYQESRKSHNPLRRALDNIFGKSK